MPLDEKDYTFDITGYSEGETCVEVDWYGKSSLKLEDQLPQEEIDILAETISLNLSVCDTAVIKFLNLQKNRHPEILTNLTKVDLHGSGIDTYSLNDIKLLSNIFTSAEEVDLSNNEINRLDTRQLKALRGAFPNAKHVDLSANSLNLFENNELIALADVFPKVETICLYLCNIDRMPVDKIKALKGLFKGVTEIDLHDKENRNNFPTKLSLEQTKALLGVLPQTKEIDLSLEYRYFDPTHPDIQLQQSDIEQLQQLQQSIVELIREDENIFTRPIVVDKVFQDQIDEILEDRKEKKRAEIFATRLLIGKINSGISNSHPAKRIISSFLFSGTPTHIMGKNPASLTSDGMESKKTAKKTRATTATHQKNKS